MVIAALTTLAVYFTQIIVTNIKLTMEKVAQDVTDKKIHLLKVELNNAYEQQQ